MEGITREEHQGSMGHIHDRVDNIGKSVASQEVIVERIEKSIDKLHQVMFGNGRDGIITKVSNLIRDRWIIRIVILSIISMAFFIIRNALVK